ncbi:ATP-binding cassette domain-containing protein [Sulfurimonas aquatica]|uniref:ATP-binding cassette domain-containing protein n=1 Tax=Sulfurimonas aquatica TaxID=2672570 RepID=UPI001A9891DF|nr:ATP-binding cassette domain-containing protein [Sulfurimonas aquatica]
MNLSTLLEVKNLSFGFTKDKLLLKDFNISLKRGEIKAIVGESGAGKSTLFELILGNIKPLSGEIKVSSYSQVFQDPYSSFHPSYTLLNQIEDVALTDELEKYLLILNLEKSLLLKLPHELSGGQLQRASILRAILMKPDVLLLDEPTSALDNVIQLEVMGMLVKHLDSMAMLLITHDIELARWCADEIVKI